MQAIRSAQGKRNEAISYFAPVLLCVVLVILFIFSIPCASELFDNRSERSLMSSKSIGEVLKEHAKTLMSIPGVVGAGEGRCEGKPCIKVFVIEKTPELDQKIPDTLEGYPVILEETGEIKALPRKQDG